MANWSDPRAGAAYATADTRSAAYDAGLRAYMLSVYNYMLSGVLLTGIIAMVVGNTSLIELIVQSTARGGYAPTMLGWIVMLSPLAIVFAMSFGQERMSEGTLKILFFVYAALMGASLSTIFITYTQSSIAGVFFATAAGFAGLSLYGYTTKKDLSGLGTFLIMGLIGLIVASIVNIFIGSGTLNLVISVIGVLIFAGLTAYDTQKIKSIYAHVAGTDMMGKVVIMGALNLYLDFINMFLFLLRLFGSSRD
jgi:FtsH-binding integral membrane protein